MITFGSCTSRYSHATVPRRTRTSRRLRGSGCSAPGGNRTPDPQIRSLMLYPTELQARRRLTDAARILSLCPDRVLRRGRCLREPRASRSAWSWPPRMTNHDAKWCRSRSARPARSRHHFPLPRHGRMKVGLRTARERFGVLAGVAAALRPRSIWKGISPRRGSAGWRNSDRSLLYRHRHPPGAPRAKSQTSTAYGPGTRVAPCIGRHRREDHDDRARSAACLDRRG
jgi:hypothetical protein